MRENYNPTLAARIGQRIRERRELLGITASRLASLTLSSTSTISRYESGATTPSADAMIMLGWALRCDPGDLLPTYSEIPEITGLAVA